MNHEQLDDADRVVSLARLLLNHGGSLESAAGEGPTDRSAISEALSEYVLNHSPDTSRADAQAVATESIASAERALLKTAGGVSPAALSDVEVASLEAIIEVTGRPAMRYRNGEPEMPADLGDNQRWRVLITTARRNIKTASTSVGRLMRTGLTGAPENIGTGWRIGRDLIVTNRHVAKLIAADPGAPALDLKLDVAKAAFIDFNANEDGSIGDHIGISEIAYCAAEPDVDLALLRIGSGAADLPEPLELDWDPDSVGLEVPGSTAATPIFKGKDVYVIGHPYKQRRSDAVATVFGTADGLKRWSPGKVLSVDANTTLLRHDCSTLGGNSGSCVFRADTHAVIGTHVGGVETDDLTDRAAANVAVAFSRLGSHPLVKMLNDLMVA